MRDGRQWIHFDVQFPLKFGHDLCERFGPAGELLFVLFLCAAKRSYPQGQIHYRTEEELRVILAADFDFVDNAGDKWSLETFWRWCGRRKVTSTRARGGRIYVTATRWNTWEDDRNSKNAERMRRSRANSVRARSRLRGEVGQGRLEVGGVRGEGRGAGIAEPAAAPSAEKLLTHLDEIKNQQPPDRADPHLNGDQP